MKVILLRANGHQPLKINLNRWHLLIPILSVLMLTLFVQLFFSEKGNSDKSTTKYLSGQFDVLLQRFAVLEAQTQRLNLLGTYLAKQTNVDIEAFNLSQKPALGGFAGKSIEPISYLMSESQLLESIKISEALLSIKNVNLNSDQANDFFIKLNHKKRYLSPVSKGYVSSNYGMRIDPINGKHRNHKGIDIAGKKGTPISTIASGFVTFSGKKGSYGNVVEIHHSDSLKSRYAHLEKILVIKGTVVRKGKKIATMGSTGRVTGSHLHVEVWKDGVAVNPENYMNLALGTKK